MIVICLILGHLRPTATPMLAVALLRIIRWIVTVGKNYLILMTGNLWIAVEAKKRLGRRQGFNMSSLSEVEFEEIAIPLLTSATRICVSSSSRM